MALITLGQDDGVHFDGGALLVLLAALFQSVFFVIQKASLRKYTSLEFTTYVVVAGLLMMLVAAPGLPAAVRAAPPAATLAAVALGLLSTTAAFLAWGYVLARVPASRAVAWLYLVPVLAVAIAWIWLSEIPTPVTLLGGLLVLAGVAIANRSRRTESDTVFVEPEPTPSSSEREQWALGHREWPWGADQDQEQGNAQEDERRAVLGKRLGGLARTRDTDMGQRCGRHHHGRVLDDPEAHDRIPHRLIHVPERGRGNGAEEQVHQEPEQ